MAKSVVKSVFSLHPLPVISTPKPPFFVHFGRFGGKNHLLRGVFLFSSRDFLAQNLILRRKNQFDGVFCLEFARISTFAGVEKRKAGVILSLPHSTRKIQADFLSKRPHFSRLPPLFYLKPPYPAQNPFHPTRRTRAYAYVRARAFSEFAIFAFTLHLTAQQAVYQPLECEGKPCIHLHLHRNNLKNNTLHDFHCKKQVKAKG